MFYMGPGKRLSRRKERALLKEFVPAPVVPLPDYSDLHRLLIITRHRLAKGWSSGTLARDEDGRATAWNSQNAASFCLVGGLLRGASDMTYGYGSDGLVNEATEVLLADLRITGVRSVSTLESWNDRHFDSFAVIQHLDRMINMFEKERLARHADVYCGC